MNLLERVQHCGGGLPAAGIALLLWGIWQITGISAAYFTDPAGSPWVLRCRLLQLVFFFVVVFLFQQAWQRRAQRNVRHAAAMATAYFAVSCVMLLIVWPGTYSLDDIVTLGFEQCNSVCPWQHFLTGVWHIICLETVPMAAGIPLVQCFVGALVVGYGVVKVPALFLQGQKERMRTCVEMLLTAAGLFPPILVQVLGGFRMGTYIFAELLLAVWLADFWKRRRVLNPLQWLTLALLVALVAAWRSEAIYYLVCFPILLLIRAGAEKKKLPWAACIGVVVVCAVTVWAGRANNRMIGNNDYSAMIIIEPLRNIVLNADTTADAQLLDDIDKVVDLDVYRAFPINTSEKLYWSENLIRTYQYSEQEYKDCLKAYVQLVLRHPKEALAPLWKLFAQSSGLEISGGKTRQRITTELTVGKERNIWEQQPEFGKAHLSEEVYHKGLLALLCFDEEQNIQPQYRFFWNLAIPLALLVFSFGWYAYQRDAFMAFLMLTLLGRVPLVFLTSTAPYIMYYLPIYLQGYFWGIVSLAQLVGKRRRNMPCKNCI